MSIAMLAAVGSLGLSAMAQDPAEIAAKVEAMQYPRLAAVAHITGDVRLALGPDGAKVVSGNGLLAAAAMKNFEELSLDYRGQVIYHFSLTNAGYHETSTVVKKGDALDRAVLRMLGLKPERTIAQYTCEPEKNRPKNRVEFGPQQVEVWVNGQDPCPMIN